MNKSLLSFIALFVCCLMAACGNAQSQNSPKKCGGPHCACGTRCIDHCRPLCDCHHTCPCKTGKCSQP